MTTEQGLIFNPNKILISEARLTLGSDTRPKGGAAWHGALPLTRGGPATNKLLVLFRSNE